jgi:hypothetical protein
LLLFLTLIALILDIIIFTDGDFLKDNLNIINDNIYDTGITIEDAKNTNTKEQHKDKSYKDINDIILEKLIYYNKLYEDTDNIKSSNAFL